MSGSASSWVASMSAKLSATSKSVSAAANDAGPSALAWSAKLPGLRELIPANPLSDLLPAANARGMKKRGGDELGTA
eukprot:CAMPEP_0183478458 /NCGR_PEP_ID=MMETSP0370-20130417/169954_1 /TAXON_ID=268820 /ORGANISM="Peridinium aciculiferum, Strain PAER-2" /LENGTH=76 /DNA_ID=CAMNT_0025671419 /DNA_START=177 /DNA_END=403 /DNA_ORIENTATION=-